MNDAGPTNAGSAWRVFKGLLSALVCALAAGLAFIGRDAGNIGTWWSAAGFLLLFQALLWVPLTRPTAAGAWLLAALALVPATFAVAVFALDEGVRWDCSQQRARARVPCELGRLLFLAGGPALSAALWVALAALVLWAAWRVRKAATA